MKAALLTKEADRVIDDLYKQLEPMLMQGEPARFLVFGLEKDDTEEFADILREFVPALLVRFAERSRDYGTRGASILGAAGQYADLNRKMIKLRRALWEGQRLTGEPVEEVVEDMIGHLLLTLKFLRDDNLRGEEL